MLYDATDMKFYDGYFNHSFDIIEIDQFNVDDDDHLNYDYER